MWILFKTLIILSSVFTLRYVSIDPFWRPKEGVFLLFGLLFLASCWLTEKSERYIFKNKWLSLFFIYVVLLFGWNFIWPFINNIETLNIVNNGIVSSIPLVLPSIWFTVLPTLNVILALLLIYHLVEHTDSISKWVGVVKVLCWVGFGLAVYAMLQFFGLDQIFPKTTVTASGNQCAKMFTFMGNKMLSANFIACVVPLFLIFKAKKYYIALVVCLISLWFLKSSFNISLAVVGICIVLLLQGKWKLTLTIFLSFIILMIIFRNQTNIPSFSSIFQSGFHGRMVMWKNVLEKSKEIILTGHGLGSMFRDFAPVNASWLRFHSCHNMFIDILYEGGLIAIILLFGYLLNLFRRLFILFLNNEQGMLLVGLCGGFVSYLIMSMGSFPHRIAPLALLGIIYIAGIEVHLSQRRRV